MNDEKHFFLRRLGSITVELKCTSFLKIRIIFKSLLIIRKFEYELRLKTVKNKNKVESG